MALFLLLARRIVFSSAVVVATGFIAFGGTRVLRSDLYPDPWWDGTKSDVSRAFLHFDFGEACGLPGCPNIAGVWHDTWYVDLWLLSGALLLAVVVGVLAGAWCAAHEGTVRARLLTGAATFAYSTPVYFFGLGLLLLFNGIFGVFPIPWFFDADPIYTQPWRDPFAFLQLYLVPWMVLAAPLGGMILRLTLSGTRDEMGAYHVRTAFAKGLTRFRVARKHAASAAYPSILSFAGASVPLLVANLILVEYVFSVPGFLRYTWRLSGHGSVTQDPTVDLAMLQAIAIWAAVITVTVNLLSDLALARVDPRVRQVPL